MICLDTNYLIMGLVAESQEAIAILDWAAQGERFCVSSIVWYEFLCGPVTDPQIAACKYLLQEIVPFEEAIASTAAQLFNLVGRKRHLRVDAMIAATAIEKNCPLATSNTPDFESFVPFKLQLAYA